MFDTFISALFTAYLGGSIAAYMNWIYRGAIDKLIPKWANTKKPRICYIIWLILCWLDFVVACIVIIVLNKNIELLISIILSINFIIKIIATSILERLIFKKFYRGENSISFNAFIKQLSQEKKKEENDEIQKESGMRENENETEETYEEQAERLKSLLPSGVEWQDAPPQSDVDNDC